MTKTVSISLAALLASGILGGVAFAAQDDGPLPDGVSAADDVEGSGATEIEGDDLLDESARSYASQYGVDDAEARRRILVMANSGEALAEIGASLGDDLAGAYFEHEPAFRFVMRSTAKGQGAQARTQEIAVDAEQADGPLTLTVAIEPGARRSKRAIENILATQGNRLMRAIPGVQGLGYDPARNLIVVDVYVEEGQSLDQAEAVAALDRIAGMETAINVIDAPLRTTAARGGGKLLNSSGGYCTAGFAATRGGVGGIVTAGHCGTNKTSYKGQDAAAHTLYDFYVPTTTNHDLLWAKTTGDEYGEFFPGTSSAYRTVTGTRFRSSTNSSGWFSSGSYVCHFGHTTGFSCGEVQSTTYQPGDAAACTSSSPCSAVWVKFSGPDLACYSGDSGGPVFADNTAFGVFSTAAFSGKAKGQCSFGTYSSVDWIEDGLGAQIKFGR